MSIPVVKNWINGAEADSAGGHEPILNPATGAPVAEVELADLPTVDAAVASAVEASAEWRETPASRRAQIMDQFSARIADQAEPLARLITTENGKTLDDARGEVARALDTLRLAGSAPSILKGEAAEQTGRDIDTYAVLHPVGVGVGITPFNFPAMIPLTMATMAIACGNAFILKPSEQDPSVSVHLARLAKEAGVPDGILNVVHGGSDAAQALIRHRDVDAVSFVGSTPAAHSVSQLGATAGVRVQALGGAKNHVVIAPDADLETAADALSSAAFGSSGQRCMAATVAVAVGSIADELVSLLKDRASAIVVGPGDRDGSDIGPLISAEARDRVMGYVSRARQSGASFVVDGSDVKVVGYESGHFVGPVLLDDVTPDMEVYREEIFGPVLVVVRVDSVTDALQLIKDSRFGNGASIYTRSGALARRFQREADVGQVGVNVPIPVPVASFGTSGWKDSLFGSAGLNAASVAFWTKPKYITTRWVDVEPGVDLGFRPN